LGKLKKHLGVWYTEEHDENGEQQYLVATMPQHVKGIIKTYKECAWEKKPKNLILLAVQEKKGKVQGRST
jgi:hypothetical protein